MAEVLPIRAPVSVPVLLGEWEEITAASVPALRDLSFRKDPTAQRLVTSLFPFVEIRETYSGLSVRSKSHVGRVEVGPLRIEIRPKLKLMPLTRLFRYAYGLRNLERFETTMSPMTAGGLQDLLVEMLCRDVEELAHRGLIRRYVPLEGEVYGLRGRLLVDRIARAGSLTSTYLPCRFHERRTNWSLNQVLLAGLRMAVGVAVDHQLKRRAHRLSRFFVDVEPLRELHLDQIDRETRNLTRLTEVCHPALRLIRLIRSSMGLSLDGGDYRHETPGFLFDMNRFFEALLSRFLGENLPPGTVADQRSFHHLFLYAPRFNPRKKPPPTLRPDFTLLSRKRLQAFLDAKYRDLWMLDCPPDWLYQLSIYALASPSRTSVLLYATTATDAVEERLEVRPAGSWASPDGGTVIIRPVRLPALADIVDSQETNRAANARRKLAESLMAL